MKIVIFIMGCVFSSVAFYLFSYIGVFDILDSVSGVEKEPHYSLPTYLSFMSVMMTSVTVVLAVFAITIGVISIYTIKEIKGKAIKMATKTATETATDVATKTATDVATKTATATATDVATKHAEKTLHPDNIQKILWKATLDSNQHDERLEE